MCGLAGGINTTTSQVEWMLDRIMHRGPDGRGIVIADDATHGHVRLAMLDLSSASSQPFQRDGTTLSFNGEIWNYKELRTELSASDEIFQSTGDTEVLAVFLNRHGLESLSRLDGMFAFAWTNREGSSYLVRDRFGKVPLYVAKTRDGYLWASERKAFPRGLQPVSVPPGHLFNLRTGEWKRWYHLPKREVITPEVVLSRLRVGVVKRVTADAPVCCLISGGLDSSLILALARQYNPDVTAFTAVFDPQSDDLKASRRLCADLSIRLIEVPITLSDDGVRDAIAAVEIPSKAQIEIAILCLPLARRIYAEGFRACLSGEAADELFGGYGNFCIAASCATEIGIVDLRKQQLSKMARGNFIRCNKAFMAEGVECRLPFMEDRLVEDAIQATKSESPTGKKLLKQAASGSVPQWVISRSKDTFQGGSGISDAVARRIARPRSYYSSELREQFGYIPKD